MRHFYRSLMSLAVLAACALGTGPASSADVRYITVINLMSMSATVELKQASQVPVARGTISSKRDHVFDIPPGNATLIVTSSPCNGKKLELPAASQKRAVISPGCYLDLQ